MFLPLSTIVEANRTLNFRLILTVITGLYYKLFSSVSIIQRVTDQIHKLHNYKQPLLKDPWNEPLAPYKLLIKMIWINNTFVKFCCCN